jgi:hypothetical protein
MQSPEPDDVLALDQKTQSQPLFSPSGGTANPGAAPRGDGSKRVCWNRLHFDNRRRYHRVGDEPSSSGQTYARRPGTMVNPGQPQCWENRNGITPFNCDPR